MTRKPTKTETANRYYLHDVMKRLDWDLHHAIETSGRIPDDWHRIALQRGPKPRIKITIRVEEEVLRFFKSMGAGHGERMALVLRAWMHGRLAGLIHGPETTDSFAGRDAPPKPDWGDTARAADLMRLDRALAGADEVLRLYDRIMAGEGEEAEKLARFREAVGKV